MRIGLFIIAYIIMAAGVSFADDSGPFSFRFGLGYDFISQEYFLNDSSDNPDPDASIEANLLKREYLDDKKGLIYIKFNPDSAHDFQLETGWEQTSDQFRVVGRGDLKFGNWNSNLRIDFDLDLKQSLEDISEPGEELFVARMKAAYRNRLSSNVEGLLRLYGENVDFDSTGEITYNYNRIGGEAGLNIYTENYNNLYFSSLIEKRNVTDSSQLDYLLIRALSAYYGYLGSTQFSGEVSFESKDYNWEDSRDDYFLTILSSDLRFSIGEENYFRALFGFENFDFRADDYLSDDYLMLRSGLIWEKDFSQLTTYFGPKIEAVSISTDSENDDDYFEYFLFGGVDLFTLNGILLIAENQFGHRSYPNNPLYNTDFLFDRATIIGSIRLYKTLNFDILFSAEWEWHQENSDDIRLYLLSAGLNYSF